MSFKVFHKFSKFVSVCLNTRPLLVLNVSNAVASIASFNRFCHCFHNIFLILTPFYGISKCLFLLMIQPHCHVALAGYAKFTHLLSMPVRVYWECLLFIARTRFLRGLREVSNEMRSERVVVRIN